MTSYSHLGWAIVSCLLLLLSTTDPLLAEEQRPELLQRIAFGSCASEQRDQPIWEQVVAKKPDLFLFVGDNIYADTNDMQVMQAKYAKLAAKPGYQKLLATCPILATWDDHDFGVNDGGAWYPHKVESQKIMLDFFGVPEDSIRRQRPGVYGSYVFGPVGKRVQVILLDTRYFRSRPTQDKRSKEEKQKLNLVGWYVPNHDPQTTILGDDQWKWLEAQLREPAEIRIIASSFQVIADEKGMESWGNFPHERQRLYELIAETKANGVFFISGDVHFSEISKTDQPRYPLYDFTSSGITNANNIWSAAVNPARVIPNPYTQPNFGLIEIDWNQPSPQIMLQTIGLQGTIAFQTTLSLDRLTAK